MKTALPVGLALLPYLLWGCHDEPAVGLGSRVDFTSSELAPNPGQPGTGGILTSGMAGSCTPNSQMTYAEASSLTWAVGAALPVTVFWPDRNDCTGFFTVTCPPIRATIERVTPEAWIADPVGSGPASSAAVSMVAVGPGKGGFRVAIANTVYPPDFILTAAQPASLMFERTSGGPFYAETIPGAVDRIDVPPGKDAGFVVTVRGKDGGQLCGPLPAVLHIDGDPVFSLDRITETDFVNFPYHVLARTTPGIGRMVFEAAGLQAVIEVSVH